MQIRVCKRFGAIIRDKSVAATLLARIPRQTYSCDWIRESVDIDNSIDVYEQYCIRAKHRHNLKKGKVRGLLLCSSTRMIHVEIANCIMYSGQNQQ
jgi:hypothetical protein